jgi:hypothetical protein
MADDNRRTISVVTAGRDWFGLNRCASYEAAKRGDIPVIRIGRLYRVPVRALEAMLDGAKPAARPKKPPPPVMSDEEWPGYG